MASIKVSNLTTSSRHVDVFDTFKKGSEQAVRNTRLANSEATAGMVALDWVNNWLTPYRHNGTAWQEVPFKVDFNNLANKPSILSSVGANDAGNALPQVNYLKSYVGANSANFSSSFTGYGNNSLPDNATYWTHGNVLRSMQAEDGSTTLTQWTATWVQGPQKFTLKGGMATFKFFKGRQVDFYIKFAEPFDEQCYSYNVSSIGVRGFGGDVYVSCDTVVANRWGFKLTFDGSSTSWELVAQREGSIMTAWWMAAGK